MTAKIFLHNNIDEKDYIRFAQKWHNNSSVIIESDISELDSKEHLFSLALSRLSDSFSEAILDIFIEDDNFYISDEDLLRCIKKGTAGLKRSIFYRANVPEYIRKLCNR